MAASTFESSAPEPELDYRLKPTSEQQEALDATIRNIGQKIPAPTYTVEGESSFGEKTPISDAAKQMAASTFESSAPEPELDYRLKPTSEQQEALDATIRNIGQKIPAPTYTVEGESSFGEKTPISDAAKQMAASTFESSALEPELDYRLQPTSEQQKA